MFNNRSEFYKSKEWALCKQQVYQDRIKDDGSVVCADCKKVLLKSFNPKTNDNRHAIVYHHEIELDDKNFNDYEISLNPKHITILCWKCHNARHSRFAGGVPQKKVYIVYGSSCSGKTTWVNENKGNNDIVLDIDSLWEYVSGKPRYVKPNAYKDLVFALWREYLDQIKMRTGYWDNAYIITTEPLSTKRNVMANSYGAELIHIDTPKEQCLQNLYNNPQGRDCQTYEKYITNYFDMFTE